MVDLEARVPSDHPISCSRSRVLLALCPVRSERLFCEQLGYNLLRLWFRSRSVEDGSFDRSVFAKNYGRMLSAPPPTRPIGAQDAGVRKAIP